ncbi:MAG: hypothetical protein LN573_05395 [Rickettsia endosymbiont of Oxypoda opaca]|nr:hypothetical protein [Rickettsia endosymbiont of Oxypoda opaca]
MYLYTQKLRLLKAQADKAELEVAILEGKYLSVTEVELTWSSLILAFRARMLELLFYPAIKKPISSGFIKNR